MRERAGGDHEIQRDQQVDRAPVGGDRHTERKRPDREQRQRFGAAAHQHDKGRDDDERDGRPAGQYAGRGQAARQRAHPRTSVKLRGRFAS
jgi:hypothetical protein